MCILEVEGGGSLGPSGSVFRMVNLIRLARQIDQSWLPQVACPLGVLNAQGLSTRLEHGRWQANTRLKEGGLILIPQIAQEKMRMQ